MGLDKTKRTLIVPDIHEQIEKLWNIAETLFPSAGRVVMLSDFMDCHGSKHHVRDTAIWIKEHPEVEKVWGNHDCHYAFKHPMFRCSGYSTHTQIEVNSILTFAEWSQFKVSTMVGKFLVSHAGYHPSKLQYRDQEQAAIDSAFSGACHPLWIPGFSVGGPVPLGGPTWLRWWELEPIEGLPQIVGHTIGKEVREQDGNYCLDTQLRHVMWVDEETNEVEIVEV